MWRPRFTFLNGASWDSNTSCFRVDRRGSIDPKCRVSKKKQLSASRSRASKVLWYYTKWRASELAQFLLVASLYTLADIYHNFYDTAKIKMNIYNTPFLKRIGYTSSLFFLVLWYPPKSSNWLLRLKSYSRLEVWGMTFGLTDKRPIRNMVSKEKKYY